MSSNKTKATVLGMPSGTASNRLKKSLLFMMAQRLFMDVCFKCGEQIQTADELSIEHKIPWMAAENPSEKFFDLENIAFSHLQCNVRSSWSHGTHRAYSRKGCRCDACRSGNTVRRQHERLAIVNS